MTYAGTTIDEVRELADELDALAAARHTPKSRMKKAARRARVIAEDIGDVIASRMAMNEASGTFFSDAEVERILSGESPVRVWRKHRRMTQADLAEATGLTDAFLSEIENGKKSPSVDALRRIAEALGATMDDLA